MSEVVQTYPFDPTGTLGGNRITNEAHAISPATWNDYHFIIPRLAPYFRETLEIIERDTGKEWIEGVDWHASHRFVQASRHSAKPIYGSITLLNKTFSGTLKLSYQTLGGEWVIDERKIYEILINQSLNPRTTTWEHVADPPCQYPVIDHQWNIVDLVGMSEVKSAIEQVASAFNQAYDFGELITSHTSSNRNPHGVTKGQIGLSSVENFPIATLAQAQSGISDDAYMTPRRTRQTIEEFGHLYTDSAMQAIQQWVMNYAVPKADYQQNLYTTLTYMNHRLDNRAHNTTAVTVGLDRIGASALMKLSEATLRFKAFLYESTK